MKFYIVPFLSLALLLSSCSTPLPVADGVPNVSADDYQTLVAKKTQKEELYSGFYNQLVISATRIDSELADAQLSQSARMLQWNLQTYKAEKAKVDTQEQKSTDFFVSFYTPEKKHSYLTSSKSVWKIFLDVNGQRYEGTATKYKGELAEIRALYPEHNRWANPYIISFPVATTATEKQSANLIITGPVATSQLQFK